MKKSWMLYALVLVLSIGFAGGCGGSDDFAFDPVIEELSRYGNVTKVEGRENWYRLVKPAGEPVTSFPEIAREKYYVVHEEDTQFYIMAPKGDLGFKPGVWYWISREAYHNYAPEPERGIEELFHPLVKHDHLLADWRVNNSRGRPLIKIRGSDQYVPVGTILRKGVVIEEAIVLPK